MNKQIPIDIIDQISSLEKTKQQELFGVIRNFINQNKSVDNWDGFTELQQNSLLQAMEEINQGKGIDHTVVMEQFREKYKNG